MLNNLPIRVKFAALYLVITVFTICIYVVTLLWFGPVVHSHTEMGAQTLPAATAIADLRSSLWQQNSFYQQAIAATSKAAKETALSSADSTGKQAAAAAADLESLLTKEQWASLQPGISAAQKASAALETAVQSGKETQLSTVAQEASSALSTADAALAGTGQQLASASKDLAQKYSGISGQVTLFYVIYTLVYIVIVWATGRMLAASIAFPLRDLEKVAHSIALGDVDIHYTHESKDEIGKLASRFKEMLGGIQEQARVLSILSEGDFTCEIQPRSDKDIVNLAIAKMIQSNNVLMSEIRTSSTEVSAAAHQIANGAQALASGATQQASSVDQFGTTLNGVRQQTENSSEAAQKVLQLTKETGNKMEQGIQSMQRLEQAMASIEESARNITKMNKVIDEIAFQTNILALNAAVEAARAGQHGKGFAVVADEVRNLAAKSASAAKETALLVEGSSKRVKEGYEIVQVTSSDINSAGEMARQNLVFIQQIASMAETQAKDISDLSIGLEQISMVVQSNSATAEESAAAAEEMSAQANVLNQILGRFSLKNLPFGQAALGMSSSSSTRISQSASSSGDDEHQRYSVPASQGYTSSEHGIQPVPGLHESGDLF